VSQARNKLEAGSKFYWFLDWISPKRQLTLNGLHDVISQKTELFSVIVQFIKKYQNTGTTAVPLNFITQNNLRNFFVANSLSHINVSAGFLNATS
jgi:hypothetical protein